MSELIYRYRKTLDTIYVTNVYFDKVTKMVEESDEIYDSSFGISVPHIGQIIYSECDGTTKDIVLYRPFGFSYEPEYNSEQCIVNNPYPDEGTVLGTRCYGYDSYEILADGLGGEKIGQLLESNSSSCGYSTSYTSTKTYTAICPNNYTGYSESTQTYTSTISQEDADTNALELARLDAESKLVCELTLVLEDLSLETKSFCVSYTPKLKSWSSFHDYSLSYAKSTDRYLYVSQNEGLHLLNTGDRGSYFNLPAYNSIVEFIVNDYPLAEKVFDNLIIISDSSDMFNSFSLISVTSKDYESSATIKLTNDFDYELEDNQVLMRYKKGQYQVNIPRDEEARIKGKYAIIRLEYSNELNKDFVLKYITTLIRQVNR